MSDTRSQVFATVDDLAALLDAGEPVALLDVRYDVERKDLRPAIETAHIPGAIYVDLATEFSSAPTALSGRRPLPDIAFLQHDARRWGINANSHVVVYDENSGSQAARAWWTLRWAGLDDVRLLDGGLDAWVAAGRPTTKDVTTPRTGNVVLHAGRMPVLDADEAAGLARRSVLLDARGLSAYLGGPAQPGKPTAGHIPGAVSAPTGDNSTAEGRFKSDKELRGRFQALGVDGSKPVGVYCGSGNAAAHEIAALTAIGIDASLYVGSWSAWSADRTRPVATGPEIAKG